MNFYKLNYLGVYDDLSSLWQSHPEGGKEGDYATVGGSVYYWNKYERNWSGLPTSSYTPARKAEHVDGDLRVNNDLHVGGNVHIHGRFTVDNADVPSGGESGESGGESGGSYDDRELRRRIEELERNKQDLLVSGKTLKTVNGHTLLGSGDVKIEEAEGIEVDQALNGDSGRPVSNGAVTAALATKLERSSIKSGAGIKVVSGMENGKPTVTITNTAPGGSGGGSTPAVAGGTAVVIADEHTATDAENTLYFFGDSPLRGVGLYNTLLRDGQLVGKDGKTYTYHPGALYRLYEDGSFDVLDDDESQGHWVDDCGGRARYNWIDADGETRHALTALPYYGRTLLGNTVVYGKTSDMAYSTLRVGGPFYARVTRVTVHYDSTLVSVLAVKRVSVDTSRESHLEVEYSELPDGSQIDFSYDGSGGTRRYYDSMQLVVKRRYVHESELSEALRAEVSFSNGDSTEVMRVLFGAATLFYKDGVFNPMGLSSVNGSLEESLIGSVVPGERYLRVQGTQTHDLALGYRLDQTRYNVLYAKLCNNRSDIGSLFLVATLEGWSAAYGLTNVPHNYYKPTTDEPSAVRSQFPLFGPWPLSVKMQDYHPEGRGANAGFPTDAEITLERVLLKVRNNGGPYHISEIGILTHQEPFEP